MLDASVLVKWFVQEEGRDRAMTILQEVAARPRAFALPALAWYEATHVLLRVSPEIEATARRLERVLHLGIPCFSATAERCTRAMRLAGELGLSGHDAHYVVLADELRGCWVTFDAKAAGRVAPRSLVECLA